MSVRAPVRPAQHAPVPARRSGRRSALVSWILAAVAFAALVIVLFGAGEGRAARADAVEAEAAAQAVDGDAGRAVDALAGLRERLDDARAIHLNLEARARKNVRRIDRLRAEIERLEAEAAAAAAAAAAPGSYPAGPSGSGGPAGIPPPTPHFPDPQPAPNCTYVPGHGPVCG